MSDEQSTWFISFTVGGEDWVSLFLFIPDKVCHKWSIRQPFMFWNVLDMDNSIGWHWIKYTDS